MKDVFNTDNTIEIIRCIHFMVRQARKEFWNMKEIYYQASQSYGGVIATEALGLMQRRLNK